MGKIAQGDWEDAKVVNPSAGPPSDEDRRKHLEFIQAVVTRMSMASSNAKSWLLPVVTAAYGYALTQRADSVALLGIMAVLVFAFLDANYLRQEKAYRKLYDDVAGLDRSGQGPRTIPIFSMDPSDADDPIEASSSTGRKLVKLGRRWFPSWAVWSSWSVAPFYGPLLVAGIAIFLRVR